jgi:undecaprenyl-diphosphatase
LNPDVWLFGQINDLAVATPWLQPVMIAYARDGLLVFAALMVAGWWVARRSGNRRAMAAAVWTPVGMLLALGLNQPLGALVGRERPYAVIGDILVLADRTSDPSFPSDHAVVAGAVTAGLLLVSRRLGLIAAAAALLMAFARVYIAAHYPLDVLVGVGFGTSITLGGWLLARPVLMAGLDRVERTRLAPVFVAQPGSSTASGD